jgi:hypothetical protein
MSRERGGDHLMSGRRGKQPFKIRREASQDRREVSGPLMNRGREEPLMRMDEGKSLS